jgi:hypothetical protein
MKKLFYLLFSVVLLSSCGELTGGKTGANDLIVDELLGGISFVKIGEGKNLLDGTMDKGGAHSFRMKFNLPEGKSLRYFVFSNKTLDNGLIVTFSRVGGELMANFTLNGVSDSRSLGSFPEVIDLALDVHNDHEDAHILLWKYGTTYGDAEECVDDGNCLYNTEYYTFPNEGPWGSQGRAPGTFWGVQGDSSLILSLEGPSGAISDA